MKGSNPMSRCHLRSRLLAGVAVTLSAVSFLDPGAALAQASSSPQGPSKDADDPAQGGDAKGDIVVTGSRIVRNGNNAPSPVTVLSTADFQTAAKPRIADVLNDFPALSGSATLRTAGVAVGGGTAGANLLNLRNLGVIRTLVLLDGRRVVPATSTGSVDVNLLPTSLIKRVDIVTGGASAVYGADAVAGTVNFILDTRFTGLKADMQAGATTRGDGASRAASLTAGTSFAGGRGHIVASGSYTSNGEVLYRNRPWATGNYIINNPAYVAGNGQPKRLLVSGAGLNVGTPGGIITGGPLKGTQFDANGNPYPFDYGVAGGAYSASPDAYDANKQIQLLAPVRQFTAFTHAEYDISDRVTLFGEFAFGKSITDQTSASYFRFGNITVFNDNAYLDPVTSARLANAGQTSFPFGKYMTNLGLATPKNNRDMYRYVVGARGELGNGLHWNLYYNHGLGHVENIVYNDAIVSRFNLAVDAVSTPNGVVCRSTLTDPTNGCVPYNLFGTQPVSAAVQNYIGGTAQQNIRLTQDEVAGDLSGSLFALPGGDLSFALGGEYRHETAAGDADAGSIVNAFFVGNYKAFSGKVSVKEGFVELVAPLFDSSPLGKHLELNGAARITDYSTSGSVWTWKIGGVYQPISSLRLRVTLSRDIRAPNINDLFSGGTLQTQTVNDPQNGNLTYTILRRTAGNPALKPEIASTLVIGGVFTPAFVPGLSLSLDYYKIKLDGAIASLTQQDIVNKCFAGETTFCSLVTRTNGIITQVDTLPVNFQVLRAAGLDIEAGYQTRIGKAVLDVRGVASYVSELSLSGTTFVTRAGEVGDNGGLGGGVPSWKGRVATTLKWDGGTTLGVTMRFVGASKLESDWTSLDINNNHVPAQFYFDLYAAQAVKLGGTRFEVFGAIDNVTDRDPPPVPSTSSLPFVLTQVNPQIYDTLGRMFRVGVRLQF